jgi:membrane dipeptidase
MRRTLVLVILIALLAGCSLLSKKTPAELHREALVVDLHSDAAMRLMNGVDFGRRDTTGHMDIPRLREGGIDLQVMACWLATETPIDFCRPHVDSMIDSLYAQLERYPDQIELCRTAAEAERIIDDDKIAIFIGIENGVAIANNLDNINHFYDRGVRYLTLTHTASNDWCISSADTAPAFHGLTDFGRDVVRRMNELGMIIDISHASPETVEEVLKITTDPVIASHSCVRALCDHDRNLTDEQIKAVAANGGVIGINFYNGYLSTAWRAASDSLFESHGAEFDSIHALYPDDGARRWQAMLPLINSVTAELDKVGVDVGTVCDHIDHIVKLVGPDYVCFGSDFDGVSGLPIGLKDCSGVPNITAELVKRGYSGKDIKKILGGNFMRVFKKVCDS